MRSEAHASEPERLAGLSSETPRLALVTGAAGGIGRAIAAALGAQGHALALVDHEVPGSSDIDESTSWYRCDLRDSDAVERLVKDVRNQQGDPAILVNNAGVFPTVSLGDLTLELWRDVFSVNLDAPMLLCQQLAPAMREDGWGRIVNIASGVTQIVRRDVAPYIASKMGLIGLTRALASDLGPAGITVNAVSPGLVATPNVRAKFAEESSDTIFEHFAKRQAIPSAIAPEDIAAAVSSLVSESMGKITGQTLLVDGGLSRL